MRLPHEAEEIARLEIDSRLPALSRKFERELSPLLGRPPGPGLDQAMRRAFVDYMIEMKDAILEAYGTRYETEGVLMEMADSTAIVAKVTGYLNESINFYAQTYSDLPLDSIRNGVSQVANEALGALALRVKKAARATGESSSPVVPHPSCGSTQPNSSPIETVPAATGSDARRGGDGEKRPRVFVSYSWDDEAHRDWVRGLAESLLADGVDVTLDRWHLAPGDQLPKFMESGVRDSDFILIICTPNYKFKSDTRAGGVGYEGTVMTAEVASGVADRKFIPILRTGRWQDAAASWLLGKVYVDLKGDPYDPVNYDLLLRTLHGQHPGAPPIGPSPLKLNFAAIGEGRPASTPYPAIGEMRGPTDLTLKERILLEVYDLYSKERNPLPGSERFRTLAKLDEVHLAILELGTEGCLSHGKPILGGVMDAIRRIPMIKITEKGRNAAEEIKRGLTGRL